LVNKTAYFRLDVQYRFHFRHPELDKFTYILVLISVMLKLCFVEMCVCVWARAPRVFTMQLFTRMRVRATTKALRISNFYLCICILLGITCTYT
jgi:hypothetical protein